MKLSGGQTEAYIVSHQQKVSDGKICLMDCIPSKNRTSATDKEEHPQAQTPVDVNEEQEGEIELDDEEDEKVGPCPDSPNPIHPETKEPPKNANVEGGKAKLKMAPKTCPGQAEDFHGEILREGTQGKKRGRPKKRAAGPSGTTRSDSSDHDEEARVAPEPHQESNKTGTVQ